MAWMDIDVFILSVARCNDDCFCTVTFPQFQVANRPLGYYLYLS